jgi:hypothetical protein
VDSVHGPWNTVVRPRARQCTCQSAVRRRYGSSAVAVRGGGGRWGRGGALTGDWVAVKRLGDGGKASAMKARGGDELRYERGGKEGGVGCGEMRRGRGAFYRCRGGAGWPDGGGEWPAAVECHDGGGGGRFGRGSAREWWGVIEAECPIFW